MLVTLAMGERLRRREVEPAALSAAARIDALIGLQQLQAWADAQSVRLLAAMDVGSELDRDRPRRDPPRLARHRGIMSRMATNGDAVAEAGPEDVRVGLAWQADGDGGLRGEVRVRNVSSRPVRLANKPVIEPLGLDGEPLDTDTVITLEFRSPGHVDIAPGEEAVAPVGWPGWDGPPASGTVRVRWPGGQVTVTADGPVQPTASGPATNLWSSWFTRAGEERS